MKYYVLGLLGSFIVSAVSGQDANEVAKRVLLLPKPQQIKFQETHHSLKPNRFIFLNLPIDDSALQTGQLFKKAIEQIGADWELSAAQGQNLAMLGMIIKLDPKHVPRSQGYHLTISPECITVIAHDTAGLFYAAKTFKQIAMQTSKSKELQCMDIEDWPDFPERGVMLDISRDKVPTMETLYLIIDRLASWKVNQLQLYTEHTFAYRDHKIVWEKASPMTAEQILLLDSYCRRQFINLVPNQNSFGHLHKWFEHESYQHLAEQMDVNTPAGFYKAWSLCPIDQNSIMFIRELYDELLPNFTSEQFNVGCDEVYDLGKGRSKDFAQTYGKERLYMDFLLKIHNETVRHEKKMQFWADGILHYPELLQSLPKDVTALVWGYGAEHPYEKQCKVISDANVKFYVCPSTNTHTSIAGRLDVGKKNMWLAAQNGIKYGAAGYLNTSWGDKGNWEALTFSWPPFAYGAAVSWAGQANKDINLPEVMDLFIFQDSAQIMGKLVCDLGNVYQITDGQSRHLSMLFFIFNDIMSDWRKHNRLHVVTIEGLNSSKKAIDETMAPLSKQQMKCDDANIVKSEVLNAMSLLRHACNVGIAKLESKDCNLVNVDPQEAAELSTELGVIIPEFERVWLLRNRPGGLVDSTKLLYQDLAIYKKLAETSTISK